MPAGWRRQHREGHPIALITACGRTDAGRRRHENEDAFAIDPALGLVVVADGMGGHARGEIAAQLAVDTIRAFVARASRDAGATWPVAIDPRRSFGANCLRGAIALANAAIHRAAAAEPELAGMGTTVAAVLVRDRELAYAGVGDSRVYLLRGRALRQLTHDDSWIEGAVASGLVAAADRHAHPLAHVLVRAVGPAPDVNVEVGDVGLEPDDRILLCSDGLTAALADERIAEILAAGPDDEAACAALVAAANDGGGPDNVTVALARPVAPPRARGRRWTWWSR
jgi:protein phosphatase